MKTLILTAGVACALALPAWAQSTSSDAPANSASVAGPVPAPQSPERLQAMRRALMARIAVYDPVENAYRAPTERERAELVDQMTASSEARIVDLPRGGVALRGDAAEVSFLVVELQPDGKAIIGHANSLKERAAPVARPRATPSTDASQPTPEARHGR